MVSRKFGIPSGRLVAGPRVRGQCSSSWTCATASSLVQPFKNYQPPSASDWLERRKSPTSKRLRELRATIRGFHCGLPPQEREARGESGSRVANLERGDCLAQVASGAHFDTRTTKRALAIGRQSKHNHKRVNNKSFSRLVNPGFCGPSIHQTHKTEPLIRPAIGGLARKTPYPPITLRPQPWPRGC